MWNVQYRLPQDYLVTLPRDPPQRMDPSEDAPRRTSTSSLHEVGQRAYQQAARLGSRLLHEGQQMLHKANLIGEGPKPLRALCFIGGLAMVVCSVGYLFFVFSFLTGPVVYILHVYEAMFGTLVMIIEAKDLACLVRFKSFVGEWLKFVTVPGGKGAFYFFIGSLGISMFTRNLSLFVAGVYMCIMGIICGLVHCGLEHQLRKTGIRIDDDDINVEAVPSSPQMLPPPSVTSMSVPSRAQHYAPIPPNEP